jgi:hypothetical protein
MRGSPARFVLVSAVTVLETLQSRGFWAHHDHQADQRLSGGRFAADIGWQDQIIWNRANAIVNRTEPDSYVWGGSPASVNP